MKAHKGLLHNGEELHNGFTQPKTLYALNSKLTIDTQYIFFNVVYDVFFFLLLVYRLQITPLYVTFLETSCWDA